MEMSSSDVVIVAAGMGMWQRHAGVVVYGQAVLGEAYQHAVEVLDSRRWTVASYRRKAHVRTYASAAPRAANSDSKA